MGFGKKIVFIILAIAFISACTKPSDEDRYYDAHKEMMQIESYQTTAKIISYIGGNKREYEFNQSFMYPDKYRLEVVSPDSIKGNVTIFNGKVAWVQHEAINQTWKMDNFEQSEEQLMFIGYFLKNFLSSENTTYHSEEFNGIDSIVITTELPGGNPYFYSQKLWLHGKDYTPLMLNIIDNENKVRFQVYYEHFIKNPNLDEAIFYLDKN